MSPRQSVAAISVAVLLVVAAVAGQERPRARDLGIRIGPYSPGRHNAITDVAGVRVGHRTMNEGEFIRTGVTAIVPHEGNLFQEKVPAGVFVGNAFGKLAGSTQVTELGTLETPIVLTNTLAVGTAVDAVVRYTLAQPGNENVRSVNALVGETNDGGLNDIRGLHVATDDVLDAIRDATSGPVAEGSVGAGTGTICFGWKGGIGTSSRTLTIGGRGIVVGVLAQTNFGGRLRIAGVPITLGVLPLPPRAGVQPPRGDAHQAADGSCMLVVATDAPIDARDLRRVAARAVYALARTGSTFSNGSGDFGIAFTTAADMRTRASDPVSPRAVLSPDALSPLFEAVMDATEEAVDNSLFRATTVKSAVGSAEAIPIEPIRRFLAGRAFPQP